MLKAVITGIVLLCAFGSKAQDDQLENAVLWEVTGNGLSKPSYIYGIINFLPKDKYSIPEEVIKGLEDCDIFASKIIYNNYARRLFNKAIRIPDNGWINDYLTDDELNQLRLLLLLDLEVKESDYYDFYSRLQPIILVTSTTSLSLGDNIIYVEDELAEEAKKNQLNLVGLGTIDEEIEAFEKFPIEDQVEAAKYMVNNYFQHIADYNKLVHYYINEQNLQKVKELTLKATNKSQQFKKVYYDDRVRHWIPKVVGLMKTGPTFFALGVPYLAGKNSIILLLENEGFNVKPVSLR